MKRASTFGAQTREMNWRTMKMMMMHAIFMRGASVAQLCFLGALFASQRRRSRRIFSLTLKRQWRGFPLISFELSQCSVMPPPSCCIFLNFAHTHKAALCFHIQMLFPSHMPCQAVYYIDPHKWGSYYSRIRTSEASLKTDATSYCS